MLCVYIHPYVKASSVFGGLVRISILPSPSKSPPSQDKKDDTNAETEFTIAKHVVAKVYAWEEGPEDHIALSPQLAAALGIHGLGDIAR